LNGSESAPLTNLLFQVVGKESTDVIQTNAIIIENTDLETKCIYFRVYPKTTELFANDSFQTVIVYNISLNKIYSY